MTNILYITASIRDSAESVSRGLSSKLVDGLAARSGGKVVTRDLVAQELPYISAERFAAHLAPAHERTPQQEELALIADELIAELLAADTIVFGVPIYNFSVPASVKAWADLVARAGTTFRYTETGPEGLLTGKKVYIAVASGGTPVGSAYDFMTPWLTFFLGFLGITDIELIAADGIMGLDGAEKIAAANLQAERLAA